MLALVRLAKQFAIAPVLAMGLMACEQPSPKLVGEPPREFRKQEGTELQTFNPAVDILFIIDDSGSMSTHQLNLRNNVDLFTNGISSNKFVDYHIGVITTDTTLNPAVNSGGGVLVGRPNIIDRNTVNGSFYLKQNIMVGVNGSGYERVFDPLKMALTEPMLSTLNMGFYRPSAYLAVVVITDAEDQSDQMDQNQTYQFLLDLKNGDSSKILTYGVIIPSNDTTGCARDEMDQTPTRIEDFFNLSRGKYYGLCDPDYGTKLAQIGADLVERVGRRVLLDRRPVIETISVRYGSQLIPPGAEAGWSYDATDNAIILGRAIKWSDQPQGTSVQVDFQPVR